VLHGSTLAVLLLVGVLILLALPTRYRRHAIVLGAAFVAVAGVATLLGLADLGSSGMDSFPSGHATGSTALVAALVGIAWRTRWRWPVLSLGLASMAGVASSRLYFGVHYPSDVLAGWALALAWVSALGLVVTAIREPERP
jgi:membrane-associated phospholipid phosphatase